MSFVKPLRAKRGGEKVDIFTRDGPSFSAVLKYTVMTPRKGIEELLMLVMVMRMMMMRRRRKRRRR